MRFADCPVCHCADHKPGMSCDGATWVRCCACGLLYDQDPPEEAFYSAYAQSGGVLPDAVASADDVKVIRATTGETVPWLNVLTMVDGQLPTGHPRGLLLEAGCGTGHILEYARQRNNWARIEGTEVHAGYVHFCRERGHTVHYHDLADGPAPGTEGKCDLIIANQVMEHLERPNDFMHGIEASLSPSGIFWATYCVAHANDATKRGEWFYWTMVAAMRLAEQNGLEFFRADYTVWSYNVMLRRRFVTDAARSKLHTLY